MVKHEMKLNKEPFESIQAGTKTIELRLNDEKRQIHFYLDAEFLGNRIGVHPNDNTATVWVQANDLIQLIQGHGTEVKTVEI